MVLPLSSPLRHRRFRDRDQNCASPVSSVRARASLFIWASINTSPLSAEVTTTATRPSASNLGANAVPSSMSAVLAWGGEALILVTAIDSSQPRGSQAAAFRGKHHETRLLRRIFLEDAGELGGDGGDVRLLHAADRHALMHGLDHHRHTLRLQRLVDGLCDLRGHRLLGLQAAGAPFDHAGELGDADDA